MKKLFFAALMVIMNTTADAQEVFCRFESGGIIRYGKVEGHKVFALDKAPWDGGKIAGNRAVAIEKVKLLYPSEPKIIFGLGKSYKESWVGKKPFKNVRFFIKPASAAASPGDTVYIPSAVDALKVEVELVIVIGKELKEADEETAAKAIFGYTAGNDIVGFTDSYYTKEGGKPEEDDPLLGSGLKVGDRFAPFGPFIYTNFNWTNRNRTLVIRDKNGKELINFSNNTASLLYTPAKIVSDLSKLMTLSPGDVIFTGTSKSFVAGDGDSVEIGIEGIGSFHNAIKIK